jgi:protein-disulfide isomerase
MNNVSDTAKHKRLALWLGVFFLIAASAVILVKASASNPSKESSAQITGDIPAVDAGDWVRGNQLATKTLIEYSDFQCPACKAYYPIMKDVEKELGASVRIAYRHFPLTQIHKNALPASTAAQAAGRQGKFWEMHDMLFDKQEAWSSLPDATDTFVDYAKELNLDAAQFRTDMESSETKERVQRDIRSGTAAGIPGTPTFFLNGKRIESPRSTASFKAALEAAE